MRHLERHTQLKRLASAVTRAVGSSALALGLMTSFAALTAAPAADATVVVLHPLDEMMHRADVVIHARVVGQDVKREEGRIITLTQIEVLDGIKGAKQGDVETVYQVGGSLDGENMHIAGAHDYAAGEEMVFFAMRHRDRLVSYGVGVGKFSVDRDAQTIVEDLGDVLVMSPTETGLQPDLNLQPRSMNSIVEFKAMLRDLLALPAPPQVTGARGAPKLAPTLNGPKRLKKAPVRLHKLAKPPVGDIDEGGQ